MTACDQTAFNQIFINVQSSLTQPLRWLFHAVVSARGAAARQAETLQVGQTPPTLLPVDIQAQ